jgi:hypothetical protein
MRTIVAALLLALPPAAFAGAQQYEPLADSVRQRLSAQVSDKAPATVHFQSAADAQRWLSDMDARLERRLPDRKQRLELLRTVHYEALLSQIRGLPGGRARLHAGDAVLDRDDRTAEA